MKKTYWLFGLVVVGLCALSLVVQAQSADLIGELFAKLSWRSIGPAVMGGRTVDIDVVESEPWIIYAAIGPSGVWKSTNNGIRWEPVFDKENTVSVGDVAIAQSHPDIVWVGTGEATCRNSVTIGDGVYKSMDAGKTWTNMGLEDTRHISRIIINPGDPNIVYVAAMGHLWGPNDERGIYKTTDGGRTWRKILFVNQDTGFADLALDPSNSLVLYAAAYDYRRQPYHFRSGGPGSGLYRTTDGGETWTRLTKDLPEGVMGRIGIAVSRSSPNVVYALIEHEDGGIWRSEDRGESWTRTCDNETYKTVNFRPFYYSQIRVDPSDDKVVYVFSGGCYRSEDMGKKFKPISGGTHPDHHALWIDPHNPLHLIDGNDGGIDITYDGGKSWQAVQHMALAEVYQLGYDMRDPYYVYCGLQDNGLWGGPSATYDTKGIFNEDWSMVGGGDGFFAQVDPSDHNLIYGNSQMNNLYRYDLRIQLSKNVRPLASIKEPPIRYNWNSPIHISPHDPKTVYTGGQYLFKTTDAGHSWVRISPDLTTNDPEKQKDSGGPITPDNTGAEIHCTIVTIAESPVAQGVIWCGTDDGNVQVTRDGGTTWTNVAKNIKGLPAYTWCPRIEASHFDAGTAYAAFDGHRNDDYNPYVFKTSDYGKTWTNITGSLPFGWVHVVREDIRNRNLLYVGTEFGIYASLDGGASWFSLKNDLPTVAVRDIAIHPRNNDLIIGTHGRGVWILDDTTPLQEMTEDILQSEAHLFGIRTCTEFFPSTRREPYSSPVYSAKNPDYGMCLNVYLKEKPKTRPHIGIKNEGGEVIFEMHLPAREGLHRQTWNLRYVPKAEDGTRIKISGVGFIAAPFAPPGEYMVELTIGEQVFRQKGLVQPDPRFRFPDEDRAAQAGHLVEVMALSKLMGLSVTAAKKIRRGLDDLQEEMIKKQGLPEEVHSAVERFQEQFSVLEEEVMPKGFGYRGSREMALRGGSLSQLVMWVGMSMSSFPQTPTETDLNQLAELSAEVHAIVDRLNAVIKEDLPRLNERLKQQGLKEIRPPREVKI